MSGPFGSPSFSLPSLSFGNENIFPVNNQLHRRPSVNESELPPKKIAKSNGSLTKSRNTQRNTNKKTSDTEQPKTIITLSREKLLTTNRQEFDSFVQSVTNGRKLSKEEKKEVSRQRKLIKNRNTAAASRKRKKDYQNQLETQYEQLQQSQNQVKEKLASLEAENQQMKKEISFFENLVHSNPIASSVWDKVKLAKKQVSLASPAMILASKYLLLCLLLLYMVVFSPVAVSQGSSNTFLTPKKNVEWNIPEVNSFDTQYSTSPTPCSDSIYDLKDTDTDLEKFLMENDNDQDFDNFNFVPTLMPPKDIPIPVSDSSFNYPKTFSGTPDDDNNNNNNSSSFSDLVDQSSNNSGVDFASFNLDELLSGTNVNNTLALNPDTDLEFDLWNDTFFDTFNTNDQQNDALPEQCRSASQIVTVPTTKYSSYKN